MANPQTENGFLQIANEIWNEVIRRDFTKRQKDIIQFIWRLSYGCKKKTAYIPMIKDFELCGVGQSNITKELKYLVDARVISWDRESCTFSVNKDYERWQVSPVRGWDEERFKSLIHLNIEKKTYQNDKSELKKQPRKVIVTYQNKKSRLIKTISRHLSKQEVGRFSIPCRCRLERVSKERFKYIFKRFTTTARDNEPKTVTAAYASVFRGGTMPPVFSNFLIPIMTKFGEQYAIELILESGETGNNPSLRHIQSIHEGWQSRGVRSREQAKANKAKARSRGDPGYNPQQQKNEQAMQKIREAMEREGERSQAVVSGYPECI